MINCNKCGKEGYHEDIAPIRMVDGYHAKLCMQCRNLFEEYIRPEMLDIVRFEAREAAAVMAGDGPLASGLATPINFEKIRLFSLAKAWVNETGEKK